jgi:hypothetical protein
MKVAVTNATRGIVHNPRKVVCMIRLEIARFKSNSEPTTQLKKPVVVPFKKPKLAPKSRTQ